MGALATDLEYRAQSTETAALGYEPVESLLAECERFVRPRVAYPNDPVAEPFRAGEAVGHVERADAAVTDASELRDAFLAERDGATSQWAALVAAVETLRSSVSRTRATVREADDTPPSEDDLNGTVAQELLTVADRRTDSVVDRVDQAAEDGEYATAVIEAGGALAAIEALRAGSAEIRNGEHQAVPSESSVRSAATRAHDAIREVVDGGDALATRLVRPGLETLGYISDRVEDGYGSPRQTQAELVYAALYASAVPAATAFVREQLV